MYLGKFITRETELGKRALLEKVELERSIKTLITSITIIEFFEPSNLQHNFWFWIFDPCDLEEKNGQAHSKHQNITSDQQAISSMNVKKCLEQNREFFE